jgi:glucan endo-1,3-alpha-glucosidase
MIWVALSTFQFKHLSSDQNWYRIGEDNYVQRMQQILSLQPDLVEVISWNDAGESHYVGNFWAEQIAGSSIGTYTRGYDHKGWLQVLPAFINAYKNNVTAVSTITPPNGKAAVGVMWYRPLLTTASCPHDPLGKPEGWQNAQDAINLAIILSGGGNYTINVYSNNSLIGSFPGTAGLNGRTVTGLRAGSGGGQRVEVVNDADRTTVISATGTKDVLSETMGICNYNYEVVGLS